MDFSIEMSHETKDEEMQLPKKDNNIDDDDHGIQENKLKTKIKDSVEPTKPASDSPDKGDTNTIEAQEKSRSWILEASIEGNSTRSIENTTSTTYHEVQTLLPLLLTVMVFIAGGAYTALLNFHEVFPRVDHIKTVNLSIFALLTFPSAIVEGFLFLTAATITFMISMLVILFALCLISRKWAWGPSLATLSLLVSVTMFVSFLAMLSKLVPHFITIGGGDVKVQGGLIVVFYSVYIMVLVLVLLFIVQRVVDGVCLGRTEKLDKIEV